MHLASTLAASPSYQRHRPERTVLYSIISGHYPRFVQEIEGSGGHLPQFVRQEFEEYLKCGLGEHGFLRVKCEGCRHEHLVAFSCKRRGFCPSCGARRMVESDAHLVDHVFPEVPVRQSVLTFPFPLRFLLAAEPKALTEVLAVVQRSIATFLIRRAGFSVSSGAKTGAVTLIQRFGSALNLNPHFGNCSCVAPPPASLQSCTRCSWTGRIRSVAARPASPAPAGPPTMTSLDFSTP